MIKLSAILIVASFALSSPCGVIAQSSMVQSQSGFGYAVDVSGPMLVVGEPLNDRIPGRGYVFDRGHDGVWQLSATLFAHDGSIGDNFGASVAIYDGRMFVGAMGNDARSGAVYVFARDAHEDWTETSAIRPHDTMTGDRFGSTIAVAEGRLFVSNDPFDGAPRVYVFEQDPGTGAWMESAVISPLGDGNHSEFGAAIAFGGGLLFIGSPSNGSGLVHLYADQDQQWASVGELAGAKPQREAIASRPSADAFGSYILFENDNLYVTAPNADRYTGKVYTFARSGDTVFSPGPNFVPFDSYPGHSFARALALSGDELWVSSLTPNRLAGGFYVMKLSGDGEAIASTKRIEPQVLPRTFYGEAMAADGNVVVVGASQDVFRSGSVFVYERDVLSGAWSSGLKLMAPRHDAYSSVLGGHIKCEDGAAEGFGCDKVDLVSFLTNDDMGMERGMLTNDVWGWTDGKTNKEYVLVGRNDGTTFIDLSDPLNPVNLGFLPRTAGSPPSIWRDMKVYKDHAFIVSDGAGAHGVQIFDLTQLRHVANPPSLFVETAHYDGVASAHNIVINENTGFAYVVGSAFGGKTCGGGSHIINIQDPANPVFAGCFAHTSTGRARTGYTHDAQCVTYSGPDERYTDRELCFAANETAISIADVTDKAHPVVVARGDYPNSGYTHQGWLSEDHRYLFVNDELDEINGGTDGTRTLIWDVAVLDDPVLINEYVSDNKASDHNLYIRGNYMYQSNYLSGLRIIDISNVEAPVEVGHFDTVPWGPDKPGFGGSWSNFPFFKSGVIVVTSGEEGLFVLKRSEVDI